MLIMKNDRHKLIDRAADYLHTVLGIGCEIADDEGRKITLPYYLKAGNLFVECFIDGQKYMLMVADELPDGSTLVKRVDEIGKVVGTQVILVLENVDVVRRRMLIANRTSFVVPGKQAYLPFMGALLTERGLANAAAVGKQAFSPAAQVLLLSHLQGNSFEGRNITDIATQFPYSIKTVAGAAKELEQAGVCTVEGDNSGKYLHLIVKEEIWDKAYAWLSSPIRDVMYCDEAELIPEALRFKTYDKALAEYTFMADFSGEAVAVYKNDDAIKKLKNNGALNPVEGRCRVELWKYNPALLAKGGTVDALSLALCYKESDDERVAGELNKLIKRLCKD